MSSKTIGITTVKGKGHTPHALIIRCNYASGASDSLHFSYAGMSWRRAKKKMAKDHAHACDLIMHTSFPDGW